MSKGSSSKTSRGQQSIHLNPKQFYAELAYTENIINSGKFCADDVTCLIEMYTRCIEYFDALFNPIALYFSEKISNTLTSSYVMKVMKVLTPQDQQTKHHQLAQPPSPKSSTKKQETFQSESSSITEPQQSQYNHQNPQKHIQQNLESSVTSLCAGQSKKNLLKIEEQQKIEHAKHKNQVIDAQTENIATRLQQRKDRVRSTSRNHDFRSIKSSSITLANSSSVTSMQHQFINNTSTPSLKPNPLLALHKKKKSNETSSNDSNSFKIDNR